MMANQNQINKVLVQEFEDGHVKITAYEPPPYPGGVEGLAFDPDADGRTFEQAVDYTQSLIGSFGDGDNVTNPRQNLSTKSTRSKVVR